MDLIETARAIAESLCLAAVIVGATMIWTARDRQASLSNFISSSVALSAGLVLLLHLISADVRPKVRPIANSVKSIQAVKSGGGDIK